MKTVVAAAIALALLPSGTNAARGECDATFRVEASFEGSIELGDLDFSSPSDGWGVGHEHREGGEPSALPFVVRYDGNSWQPATTPRQPRRGTLELTSVSVAGETAWASGFRRRGTERTYVVSWDGGQWVRHETPNPGVGAGISSLDALAPDDVWAVGHFERRDGEIETMVLHFDGRTWSLVEAPSPGSDTRLAGVSAATTRAVWAIGSRGDRGLTLRYDGQRWSTVRLPDRLRAGNASTFDAVAVVEPDDARITGVRFRRLEPEGIALRWTREWGMTTLPAARGHERIFDLDRAEDEVWGVGWRFVPERAFPYAMRWEDDSLARIKVGGGSTPGALEAVAFDTANTMWAAGRRGDDAVLYRACVD